MGEWKDGTLSEIAEITMGQSPNGESCNNIGIGKPLLNGPTEFGYKHPKPIQYTLKSTKISQEGDILFCVRGSTTGRMNWADQEYVIGRGLAAIHHRSGKDLQYFVKGIIDYNLPILLASATGSTFPNVSRKQLEDLQIVIPPLSEQRAIASMLSSLDDKIDLLHRQNKTLEAMAETLFRQWFVEEADEGWEEKPLSFYGEIICGKTPSKKVLNYFDGNVPFIKIPDMHNNVFVFDTDDSLTEAGKLSQANKTLPPKAICVSCIATVGLVSMTTKESQTNQQINSIIPYKEFYRYYLYMVIRSNKDLLNTMASGGTATLNLNTGDFSKIAVIYPGDSSLMGFHREIEPLFNKILFNQSQIRTLEKLRDTILPKLMSGEVRVDV